MMSRLTRIAGYSWFIGRLLMRDPQFVFWNIGFFLVMLVLFVGGLSGGDAAVRSALTATTVSVGLAAGLLFSIGVGVTSARERGVFRQYEAAGLGAGTMFAATVLARAVIALGAAVLQVAVARLAFGVAVASPAALVILVPATAAFAAISVVIALWSSSAHAANRLANLALIPLMALGGATLPPSMLPMAWNGVRRVLPIAPLHEGIVGALVGAPGSSALAEQAGLLLSWTAVALIAAHLIPRTALTARPGGARE